MTDEDAAILRQAANELTRLSNQFRGLLELGPVLQRIGSLPQVEAEAQARINQLNDKYQETRASMEVEKAQHSETMVRRIKAAEKELDAKLLGKRTELTNIQAEHDHAAAKLKTVRENLNSHSHQIEVSHDELEELIEQIKKKTQALKDVQDQHKAFVASISGIK